MSMQQATAGPQRRRLAHAARGRDLRLPDCDDQLRPALVARLLPHPDVAGAITGAAKCSRWRFAIQNLLWGIGQPFAGGIADRFGATRVMIVGAPLMRCGPRADGARHHARHARLSAGVLIGFGLSGCSFNLVIGAFGKLLPDGVALARVRRRHRRRLVRPVPLFADRRGADGQIRLADGAA